MRRLSTFVAICWLAELPWDEGSDQDWYYPVAGFGVGAVLGAIFPQEHRKKVFRR